MLIIHQPEVVKTENGVRLQSLFEVDGKEDVLWYEVDEKYEEYFTPERADAFVVGLFLLAYKEGHDIKVQAPLSEKLYYTLNRYLLPLIAEIRGIKSIKVHCSNIVSKLLPNKGAVGTGLSCGIDSFSTIVDHIKEDCPEDYKITHFTFFNVGSNGMLGGDKARNLFKKRANIVREDTDNIRK